MGIVCCHNSYQIYLTSVLFGLVQQEDELKKGEMEADTDRMMKEYRAQLDAERARKLAHGRNRSGSKSGHEKGIYLMSSYINISKINEIF